ncbi:PDGLE domain-containing protein [Heliobacterium mobile]|nr:PDGLE domain-containing protein [Heliobacterium mobile]
MVERKKNMGRWIGLLVIALAIAAFLSPWASSSPDGLERVAEDYGFSEKADKSVLEGIFPDYLIPGLDNEGLATAAAGIVGTTITFGLLTLLGKKMARPSADSRQGEEVSD